MLDESEVKPPFFPPFTPPKKRAPESRAEGGHAFCFSWRTPSLHEAALTLLGANSAVCRHTKHTFRLFAPPDLLPFLLPPYPPSTPPPTPPLPQPSVSWLPKPALPPPPLPPPPLPPPTPPCQSPLLVARLLLLRLFNRIVLASDSCCGVGNKIQNAKKQTRRAASRQSQTLRAVQ